MIVLAVQDEGFELSGRGVHRGDERERAGDKEEARGEHGEDLRAPEVRRFVKRFAGAWAQKKARLDEPRLQVVGRGTRRIFRS